MFALTMDPFSISIAFIAFASATLGFVCYSILKSKFPGSGLKMVQDIFKETTSFEEAIKALQEGKRVRRKTERKGFTRIVITESKNRVEKYGIYWVGDKDISDNCSFSIDDVLAKDWIVDD